MDDNSIREHIESLVAEEHRLQNRESHDATSEEALAADRERLDQVTIELDRCWDLLRQRQALRSAGDDPDEAQERDASTVERYLQ